MQFRDAKGRFRMTPTRAAAWVVRSVRRSFTASRLRILNRFSKRTVTAKGSPSVVSLTTHGPRLANVHVTIESIARGLRRPGRIILWLDDFDDSTALTPGLDRLVARGLEIMSGHHEYGPHNKYYPFVASEPSFDGVLVTADDDLIYPKWWLSRLLRSRTNVDDDVITCFRAHRIGMDGREIAPYDSWSTPHGLVPSHLNFLTGVAGVAYPPSFLAKLRESAVEFLQCSPRADDVWLNVVALRYGYRVALVEPRVRMFDIVPGSQRVSLLASNVRSGRNDEQIRATYSVDDINKLSDAV